LPLRHELALRMVTNGPRLLIGPVLYHHSPGQKTDKQQQTKPPTMWLTWPGYSKQDKTNWATDHIATRSPQPTN